MNDNKKTAKPHSFSRRFRVAEIETRLISAMVKADGWSLEQFVDAPSWLVTLYNRHATAVRHEIAAMESLKPIV